MKNLVKLFLIVIAIMMATDKLFSQEFGIKAGFNSSNMHIVSESWVLSSKMKTGFHIGATAEFPLTEIFSLETGLLLSSKGFIEEIKDFNYKVIFNPLYLDIPLTVKASSYIGGTKVYGMFGSYIGIGLSGTIKGEVIVDGLTTSQEIDIEWGSDIDSDFKRMDL